ncbi:phosphatase PAP2 family protein [Nocardia sp. 2]|uniref:Phosphatase PAP2 family protein n=1 Tax=Nocardia acididurans TaxID=2802282 RepID=A0ABS1M243_9NOCA|nr:phosphatase PAP2 family protein [Nocardia acididurans]MBL1074728.1 phosphatase PAP2 family protein [Nocardia acididurans]
MAANETGGTREVAIRRAVTALGVFIAFGAVAWQVVTAGWLTGGDQGTLNWFVGHRAAGWTILAEEITFFGNPERAVLIAAAMAAFVGWRYRSWRGAILVAMTVATATAVGHIIKRAVGRERPPVDTRVVDATGMSFPSGHATATAAFVGVAVLVYLRTHKGLVRSVIAVTCGTLAVAVMATTRLYLGVHWLTDVLGGALLGLGVVLVAAVVQVFWWPQENRDELGARKIRGRVPGNHA